jgi:TolB-like protein
VRTLQKLTVIALAVISLLITAGPAFSASKPIVAVMSLQTTGGVDSSISVPLSDKLRQELLRTRRFVVVTRSEMDRIVTEQTLHLSDCTSNDCVVRMGQILGAEKMVSGRISKLGRKYVIAAELIDVETARIDRAASVECDCPIEELTRPIAELAARLAGIGYRPSDRGSLAIQDGFGMLEVKSSPLGATIFLDGIEAGTTPTLIEDVSAGTHELELIHGQRSARQTVKIEADQVSKISLELQLERGKVSISSIPSEAMVFFNNRMIGRTPLIVSDLEPGEHTVALHYELYQTLEERINVAPGEDVRREFKMQLGSFLTVKTTPQNADLYINGEHYGKAEGELMLPHGEYRVSLRLPNYLPFDKTFRLVPGEAFEIEAQLKINPAWINYQEDIRKNKIWQYGSLVVTAIGAAATVVATVQMSAAEKDGQSAKSDADAARTIDEADAAERNYTEARNSYANYGLVQGLSVVVLASGVISTYYAYRMRPKKPTTNFPVAKLEPSLQITPERTVLSLGISW